MILNQAQARKQNDYISFAYIFYHILMLIFSLIGVSTTLMMVAEAFHITLGYNIGKAWCYAIVVLPVVLYAAGCLMSNDQDLQLSMAKWLSLAFRFVMSSENLFYFTIDSSSSLRVLDTNEVYSAFDEMDSQT